MSLVGRVSSLISQGVFSVATPFHPFGGAVDIIVVEQHDGTFKSTPWYVRFGKFQGVLKGAEKIVRMEVNGIEANFNMYLDNSGEAYFVREVDPGKDCFDGFVNELENLEGRREDNATECSTIDNMENDIYKEDAGDFNNDNVEVRDERVTLGMDRLDRVDSDCDRIFYELQDEKSSLDGSFKFSEYDDSSTYNNLDRVEQALESQNSNSEVVLVSVDGHILTAPISLSGRKAENAELSTPTSGYGHVVGPEEYGQGECTPPTDCLNESEVSIDTNCKRNSVIVSSECHLEPCVGDKECMHREQDCQVSDNQEKEPSIDINYDVFRSCLELQQLAEPSSNDDQENMDPSGSIPETADHPSENSLPSPSVYKIEEGNLDKSSYNDELSLCDSGNPSDMGHDGSDNTPVHFASNYEEPLQQVEECSTSKRVHCGEEYPVSNENGENGHAEHQNGTLVDFNPDVLSKFEFSLCGHLLHPGMGLSSAKDAFDANRLSMEEFKLSFKSFVENKYLVARMQGQYLPWNKAEPIILGMEACGLDLPVEPSDVIPVEQETACGLDVPVGSSDVIPVEQETQNMKEGNPIPSRGWSLWSIPFRRVKIPEQGSNASSNEDVLVDSDSASRGQDIFLTPTAREFTNSPRKQIIRTNVPTTEEIASLNLKEGQNMIAFVFSTRVLGSQKVEAHIYLWKWNTRIVISDVDGTITKSDVLGQFMPLVGKDWTHSGIARLFCAIKENGYQLLFLSARAIVQSYLTKSFLFNLKQDGKSLPIGPVVISPDGLFPSLYREVIRRAPHEFKIACLEDIKALFPHDYNPFYAGFGNRDTDELSYRKIGIPKGKIFIINPKGEVAINHQIDVKSYTSLHTLVHDMFPPTSLVEQEDFNSWNYWKMPLPDID